jgi:hypothetical protein
MALEKVLIAVKTYPVISERYKELGHEPIKGIHSAVGS